MYMIYILTNNDAQHNKDYKIKQNADTIDELKLLIKKNSIDERFFKSVRKAER